MHEGGAAFGDDDLVRPQPASVLAARTERVDVLEKPRRMARHPRVAGRRRPRPASARRFTQPDVVVEGALAPDLRPVVGERRIGRGRDVPELVQQVHHLVVAEQRLDPSAGALGLVLEPHQEVERLPHLGAAVEDVAGLHEDRRAARPLPLGVDEARGLQNFDELIERAVDVADGDDARPGAACDRRAGAGTPRARRRHGSVRTRGRAGTASTGSDRRPSGDHNAWAKRDSITLSPDGQSRAWKSPATAGYEASGPGRTLTTSTGALMTPRRYMPALLLLFVASGCAALIYEIVWFQLLQLVIGSSAVSLAVLLGHVHGRHVPRQLPAAALHLGARASAARLRVHGDRHRRARAPHPLRRARLSRTSTPRGAVRARSASSSAPSPPASACCRRRC